MELNHGQLIKAKECKTVEELLAYANEIGYKLTEEEAKMYFNELHKEGELSDEELSNVAGGSFCVDGTFYSEDPDHWHNMIVTAFDSCQFWYSEDGESDSGICSSCGYSVYDGGTLYCHAWYIADNGEVGYEVHT